MDLREIAAMFHSLGLERPTTIYIAFGDWHEEGVPLMSEREERAAEVERMLDPPKECTCCECYFEVGPPGCDGTNCHHCGRDH